MLHVNDAPLFRFWDFNLLLKVCAKKARKGPIRDLFLKKIQYYCCVEPGEVPIPLPVPPVEPLVPVEVSELVLVLELELEGELVPFLAERFILVVVLLWVTVVPPSLVSVPVPVL